MRLYHVDAFAEAPFTGNPAAVCVLTGPRGEGWMQAVAQEMNLSETAFVHPDGAAFGLRWFTPVAEVDMCGHATLATAHVLWEIGSLRPEDDARFNTASGLLSAARRGEEIELDFPARPPEKTEAPPGLADALGATPRFVGRSRADLLVEVDSADVVRGLRPDFAALLELPVRGVMVTSADSSGAYDFISRFFAPAVGVNEDPVTGSSHCCLGPYWGERLGKTRLVAHQASRRGGVVRVRLAGDRVRLGGHAITIVRGELTD